MRILTAAMAAVALISTSPAARVDRSEGIAAAQIDAPRITQQEFKKLVALKKVVIVDTRVEDVFELGHIPGAVRLPLEGRLTWPESYEKTVSMLIASKKPVVTYCA
jgi:rhodanese-related sulfurtransferase